MLPTKFGEFDFGFRSRSKKEIFKMAAMVAFLTGTILAIFDLQVTLMLPSKFGVNWPFSLGEVKNRFSRRPPSWISDRNNFSYF